MGQMAQPITVDVKISQELRDLLSDRSRREAPDASAGPLAPAVPAAEPDVAAPDAAAPDTGSRQRPDKANPPAPQAVPLVPVVLRRDGDRPLRFRGACLLAFDGPLTLGDCLCAQRVQLFQDAAGGLVLALSLTPSEDAPARPIHRCYELMEGVGLGPVLASWLRLIDVHIGRRTGAVPPAPDAPPDAPPDTQHPDLTGWFHDLTAHCLVPRQTPNERT